MEYSHKLNSDLENHKPVKAFCECKDPFGNLDFPSNLHMVRLQNPAYEKLHTPNRYEIDD